MPTRRKSLSRHLEIYIMNIKKTLISLLSIATLAGCGKTEKTTVADRVVPVRVAIAETKEVPLYVDGIGVCSAYESVNIYSQVSGKILSEHFEQGRIVEKDQLLFKIDPRLYEGQAEQARGQLQAAQAKLRVDQLQLERSQQLKEKGYISDQDYDTLKAIVEQDMGTVDGLKGVVKQAETNLDFCSVKSPIRGLAGEKLTNVGNLVAPPMDAANGQPLLVVRSIDPLYIDFSVSENEFAQLLEFFLQKQSLDCEIWKIAEPTIRSHARLEVINNQISRGSGNVRLRAVMENANHQFWPGQSVGIRVSLTQIPEAILAPEVAVGISQAGRYVFIVNDQSLAELRPVEIGQIHGSSVIFKKGIKAGDRVVVQGQFVLAPNTKVSIVQDAPSIPAKAPELKTTSEKTKAAEPKSASTLENNKK